MENHSDTPGRARSGQREVRLPPLPPGLEVYRPADVLGSSVLVVEDEAAMLQQLRIDLHDLGYRPSVAATVSEARDVLEHERSYFVKGNVPMAHIYSDLAARLVERGTGRPGTYRFGRLEFDPTRRIIRLGEQEARLTQQQTALVLFLAQGSKPATARDLIQAGLFRNNAAHSTVHSALLTLRRRLDDLQPGLGATFVRASARGYSLVAVHN